jgi:sugar phosphate isomerase/epimerase
MNELVDTVSLKQNKESDRGKKGLLYDISFSTMWGMKKFNDLGDFLLAAHRLGLPRIELNHQIRSSMLVGVDLSDYEISSVHEPCPAVIPVEELRKRDLLISSPDESRRRQGVEAVKRSIEQAHELNAHTVVVHTGQIQAETQLESEMSDLFNQGLERSDRFHALRSRFMDLRASLIDPYLEAVKQSLQELLIYAEPHGIRLGLENRYHYLDIPAIDEMGELLVLAEPERLGFLYDVGHAQVQDRFGFARHEEWLKRYANRIIGVHLHDVKGIHDHLAPGFGEVDFRMVASWLPKDAYRTLEVQSFNTPEQVRAGLDVLYNTGCIALYE